MKVHSHCSYCGARYAAEAPWPRACGECRAITYRNPLPVAVAVVPVGSALLVLRRNIEPRKGQLALPGGYIEWGESWQQATARELLEETRLAIDPAGVTSFDLHSAPDGTLLVFGLTPPITPEQFHSAATTPEASELVLLEAPAEMGFPLHNRVVHRYFESRSART